MSKLIALQRHRGLLLLLILYVIVAILFSLNIPLSKAPDEYVHFLYTRFLIDHKRPPISFEEQQTAGYKSDQPPLYYSIVALATAPIDVSEPPSFKFSWEPASRQLIDIVLPRTLLIHTEDELWPFRGLFLAWFVGRWVSIMLSSLTLILTYLIALEIFPKEKWLALAAAATLAFIPRYLVIGSVLSDDNLVGLLMALFLYVVVRLFKYRRHILMNLAASGVIVGLALSTKYSVLLVPLEMLLLLLWLAWRQQWGWPRLLARLSVFGLTMSLVAGAWLSFLWWHFNQIQEHGLLLGLIRPIMAGGNNELETAAILDTVGGGGMAASFPEGNLGNWLLFMFTQFWDVPIVGVARPYPLGPVLLGAAILCVLAGFGWRRRWQQNEASPRLWLGLLLLHIATFLPIPLVRFIAIGDIHDTAQARHLLFPAAPAIAIWLAAGLVAAFPKKWAKTAGLATAGLALMLSLAHLYYYIVGFPPPLPVRTDPALAAVPDHKLAVQFADGLSLRGYDWQLNDDRLLELSLHWFAGQTPQLDYRTEVTVRNSQGAAQLRWLSQPARGRLPTRAWDAGDSVRDTLHIPLVDLPPGDYKVALRLLDWDSVPLAFSHDDSLPLFELSLDSAAPIGPPALWQRGQIVQQPTYRYRAAIPLTGTGGRPARAVDAAGQRYTPVSSSANLQLFLVDYDWPTGDYRVQVEGMATDLSFRVENFDWDFERPEMMYEVNVDFRDEIRLLGYDLPLRRVAAGKGVPLVLYWQGLRRMMNSYIIFDRLLDARQQPWGGYDRLPKETYPTNLWVPGEIVTDGFAVPVDPAAPDGVYQIVVGLYNQADPAAQSLPLYQAGQPLQANSITIGPIKVGGPPPEVVLPESQLSPQVPLTQELGQPPVIRLRGYDLAQTNETLQLTLYWHGLAPTPINWTTFVHLRNEAGETVAQVDGPPAAGEYPTSLWDKGEIIPDKHTLALPPQIKPGVYQLVVGLYDPFTFDRLSIAASVDNSQVLTRVTLK